MVNQVQNRGLTVLGPLEEEEEGEARGRQQTAESGQNKEEQPSSRQQPSGTEDASAMPEEEELTQPKCAAADSRQSQGDQQRQAESSSILSQPQANSWYVLIDAAKACATAPPDLTKHPADFVVSRLDRGSHCMHAASLAATLDLRLDRDQALQLLCQVSVLRRDVVLLVLMQFA